MNNIALPGLIYPDTSIFWGEFLVFFLVCISCSVARRSTKLCFFSPFFFHPPHPLNRLKERFKWNTACSFMPNFMLTVLKWRFAYRSGCYAAALALIAAGERFYIRAYSLRVHVYIYIYIDVLCSPGARRNMCTVTRYLLGHPVTVWHSHPVSLSGWTSKETSSYYGN